MKDQAAKSVISLGNDVECNIQDNTLYIPKQLGLEQVADFVNKIPKEIRKRKPKGFIFNLDELQNIDSAGVTALSYVIDKLEESRITIRKEGGSKEVLEKIELFSTKKIDKSVTSTKVGFFESVGESVSNFFSNYLMDFLSLAADVFYWAVAGFFNTKSRRKGEIVNQSVLIGVNAVLIVVLMSFIIGLVLALQSSQQLRSFGANIYIVDLVVVGMMSEMGALITAILVAGRSGSSIAAEIATMKVTSELDALKTMGLNPIRFVVVPKLYACLLTLPFLIVLSNVSGIFGGGVAAYHYLDITPEIFINRMGKVMSNKDLITSFVKSQVYASLIVLTGSFYGFRVERGAEGVGKVTTIAVVVAISLVIVADSILGLLFY